MTTLTEHRALHPDSLTMPLEAVDVELALRMGIHFWQEGSEGAEDDAEWILDPDGVIRSANCESAWHPTTDHAQAAEVRRAVARETGLPVAVSCTPNGQAIGWVELKLCHQSATEPKASARVCLMAWRQFDAEGE